MESDDGTFDGAQPMSVEDVQDSLKDELYNITRQTGMRYTDLVVVMLEDK
jgi:hypothetical protein